MVEEVLAQGGSIREQSSDGLTPLILCTLYDCSENLLDFLLQLGADPNVCDVDGFRPLHLAKSVAKVNLLVAAGAQVDAADYVSCFSCSLVDYAQLTDGPVS